METRVVSIPKVSSIATDKDTVFGEVRRSQLSDEFEVVLQVDGILDVSFVRRPSLGIYPIECSLDEGVIEVKPYGLIQQGLRQGHECTGGKSGKRRKLGPDVTCGLVEPYCGFIDLSKVLLRLRTDDLYVLVPFGCD